jgi:hypothetical protein
MPTPITETTVNFTYKVADEIFSTSDAAGNTASATYEGPDRIWVFVDEETGLFARNQPDLTTKDDGADVPSPMGTVKVELVAEDNPLIISIIRSDLATTLEQTIETELLPDGCTHKYNNPADIDQTYDIDQLVYDLNTNTWNTPVYKESTQSWTDVIKVRNNMLLASDGKIAPDMPEDIKATWVTYRAALRDLTTTFGYGTDAETPAWKVRLPEEPGTGED